MKYKVKKKFLIALSAMITGFYPVLPCHASGSYKPDRVIAQNLGGIVREIDLNDIPPPAITSAKTATDAQFTKARNEIKSDGTSRYVLRGKNQQGFIVEVQVNAIGTISQIDEQIDSSGVPETAVKVFKKWAPNKEVISTWKSTRLGEIFYEFVIEDHWLEISPDGDKVVIHRQKIKYQ